jgi:DNA-binding NtrC family response regulator
VIRASVLCASRQKDLLKSRCEALQQEQFHVASSLSLKETGKKFLQGDFDVVVFGHTIPVPEQAATAEVIRKVSPSTKIVALTDAEEWRSYADDTVLYSNTRALVATCADLMSTKSRMRQ